MSVFQWQLGRFGLQRVTSIPPLTDFAFDDLFCLPDVLMQNVVSGAQREIPKYPQGVPPEPAFILTLSNEVYNGASLFAVQKAFEGEFSFDVYYDAPSVAPQDGQSGPRLRVR